MKENKITTHKFFDERKRRLAIRAIDNKYNMEVIILTCGKKDAFNKKFARQALDLVEKNETTRLYGQLLHPQGIIVSYGGDFRESFFNWAEHNYFKIGYKTDYVRIKQLEKANERIYLSQEKIGKW